MSVSSARTRCGLYMAAKKRPKFDAFVDYAWARGIDIVDLALDDAPDVFSPHLGLDVVLHKFTDDLATAHADAGAARRLANFEALLASHTHTHLHLLFLLHLHYRPEIITLFHRSQEKKIRQSSPKEQPTSPPPPPIPPNAQKLRGRQLPHRST